METLPIPAPPLLCIGIDVGKTTHVAGLVSQELLKSRKRLLACPTFSFGQSRAEIDRFFSFIRPYAPLAQCAVLLEQTGHYHRALLEDLQSFGVQVFVLSVHTRHKNRSKTDKHDALRLAHRLYSQLVLDLAPEDGNHISRRLPPVPAAAALAPLVQLRLEHVQQATRLRNKLTAIADELFPEFATIFRDVNGKVALSFRVYAPTPAAIAAASFEDLAELKRGHYPSDEQIHQLQDVAAVSIGVKQADRLQGLLLEQRQLISQLHLLQEYLAELDALIGQKLESSREGQILLSLPVIGVQHAAVLLAEIGNIRNFPRASHLRAFMGWCPLSFQTGTTSDYDRQMRGGNRLLKREMYLIAIHACQSEPWKSFYQRLVKKKCAFDGRLGRFQGRMKVIGRLAGTIATVLFALLKADAEVVDAAEKAGIPAPAPQLYCQQTHQAHRAGHLRSRPQPEKSA